MAGAVASVADLLRELEDESNPAKAAAPGASSSFDVTSFVTEALDRLPIDNLRDVLASQVEGVRSRLALALQQDYGKFAALSSQLEGFDAALVSLSQPLHEANNALKDATGAVAEFDARLSTLDEQGRNAAKRQVAAALIAEGMAAAEAAQRNLKGDNSVEPSSLPSSLSPLALACRRVSFSLARAKKSFDYANKCAETSKAILGTIRTATGGATEEEGEGVESELGATIVRLGLSIKDGSQRALHELLQQLLVLPNAGIDDSINNGGVGGAAAEEQQATSVVLLPDGIPTAGGSNQDDNDDSDDVDWGFVDAEPNEDQASKNNGERAKKARRRSSQRLFALPASSTVASSVLSSSLPSSSSAVASGVNTSPTEAALRQALAMVLVGTGSGGGDDAAPPLVALCTTVATTVTQPLIARCFAPSLLDAGGPKNGARGFTKCLDAFCRNLGLLSSASASSGADESQSTARLLRLLLSSSASVSGPEASATLLVNGVWAPFVAWLLGSPLESLLSGSASSPGGASGGTSSAVQKSAGPGIASRAGAVGATAAPASGSGSAGGAASASYIFSGAVPPLFFSHYKALDTLVTSRLPLFVASALASSSVAPSSSSSSSSSSPLSLTSKMLAASPASAALEKFLRPKLAVYWQLRSAEVTAQVEKALALAPPSAPAPAPAPQPQQAPAPGTATPPAPQPALLPPAPPLLPSALHDLSVLATTFSKGKGAAMSGSATASQGSTAAASAAAATVSALDILSGVVPPSIDAKLVVKASLALAGPAESVSSSSSSSAAMTLVIPQSLTVLSSLQSLWSPQSFLSPLASEVASLTLAILGRFAVWCIVGAVSADFKHEVGKDMLEALHSNSNTSSKAGALASSLMTAIPAKWAQAALSEITKTSSATTAATTSAAVNLGWGAGDSSGVSINASPETIIAVAHDCLALASLVSTGLVSRAAWLLGAVDGSPSSPLTASAGTSNSNSGSVAFLRALRDTADRLAGLASLSTHAAAGATPSLPFMLLPLQSSLLRPLKSSVASAVRGVPAAFRFGSGGPGGGAGAGAGGVPRFASPFLLPSGPGNAPCQLLKHPRAVINAAAAALSQESVSSAAAFPPASFLLASAVAAEVASSFSTTLASVLDNASQMDASLQWLRQGQGVGGAATSTAGGISSSALAGGPATESDRIGAQFWLDCVALTRELLLLLLAGLGGAADSAKQEALIPLLGAADPGDAADEADSSLLLQHLAPVLAGSSATTGMSVDLAAALLKSRYAPQGLWKGVRKVKQFAALVSPAGGGR